MHGKSYVLKKAKRLDIWSRGSISLAALTMRMYLPFNIYLPLGSCAPCEAYAILF